MDGYNKLKEMQIIIIFIISLIINNINGLTVKQQMFIEKYPTMTQGEKDEYKSTLSSEEKVELINSGMLSEKDKADLQSENTGNVNKNNEDQNNGVDNQTYKKEIAIIKNIGRDPTMRYANKETQVIYTYTSNSEKNKMDYMKIMIMSAIMSVIITLI